ncbi:hypothetical protein AMECASPLE_000366 [Ameca splendens]|uniref:Uncharacterized protein n=1 Tax=Ameca splendens TaxID=208324 RepID=A0ABV0Z6H1_9TELE
MANLPLAFSAVSNKGFSPHPSFGSGLGGSSRPSRRLQTDVLGRAEHAQLDVTSGCGAVKEAKWLSALQRRRYVRQTTSIDLFQALPHEKLWLNSNQQDFSEYADMTYATFVECSY